MNRLISTILYDDVRKVKTGASRPLNLPDGYAMIKQKSRPGKPETIRIIQEALHCEGQIPAEDCADGF